MKKLLAVVSVLLCLAVLTVSFLGCAKKEEAEKPAAKEEVAPAETAKVAPAESLEAAPPETVKTE